VSSAFNINPLPISRQLFQQEAKLQVSSYKQFLISGKIYGCSCAWHKGLSGSGSMAPLILNLWL